MRTGFETQRAENRQDHGKIFDTLAELAGTAIKHEEKLIADRRDINTIKTEIELAAVKREKTTDEVNNLKINLAKIGKVV